MGARHADSERPIPLTGSKISATDIGLNTCTRARARARARAGANLSEMVLAGPPAHVSSLTLVLIDSHWYRLTCTSHVYAFLRSLHPSLPPLCLSLARSRSLTHSHTLSVSLYPSLSLSLSLAFFISLPHTHTHSGRARPQRALPTSGSLPTQRPCREYCLKDPRPPQYICQAQNRAATRHSRTPCSARLRKEKIKKDGAQ